MATLTFSIASGPVTGSKAYTLSDGDMTRWLNAARSWYPTEGDPLTNAQLLSRWADEVVKTMKNQVIDVETTEAKNAITPITVT